MFSSGHKMCILHNTFRGVSEAQGQGQAGHELHVPPHSSSTRDVMRIREECGWLLCKELGISRGWEFNDLLFRACQMFPCQNCCIEKSTGRPSRWRRSKTWRSPSSPQIHQKYIYTWNNSYRTPTERWQKTSDLPKGKKLPTYLGREKEKRKTETKE